MSTLYDINKTLVLPSGYKTSLIYPIKPTGLLSELVFSRSTTGNRLNKNLVVENVNVNTPRLNYNTVNGCPSILFEPARTNLVLNSSDVTNANWNKARVTIANTSDTTPINGVTARKITVNSLGGLRCNQVITGLTDGARYVYKQYIKKDNLDTVTTIISDSGEAVVLSSLSYTFSTNSFTGDNGIRYVVDRTSTILSDGWVLIKIYIVIPTGQTTLRFNSWLPGASFANAVAVGDAVFVSNAQIETGVFDTSDIITTNSSVTRTADIITDATPQFMNLGSKGTIVLDISNIKVTNSGAFAGFVIGDNYVNQQIALANQSTDGIGVYNYNNSTFTFPRFTTNSKILIKFDGNYVCGYRNGTKVSETYNTTGLNITQIKDWYNSLNSFELNSLQVYPIALSDADCVKLTT